MLLICKIHSKYSLAEGTSPM